MRYLTDPYQHYVGEMVRHMLHDATAGMRAEGVSEERILRVLNRMLYGHPIFGALFECAATGPIATSTGC
jgi:hypothetical protein